MPSNKKSKRYGLRGEIPQKPNYTGELNTPIAFEKSAPLCPTILADSPKTRAQFEDDLKVYFQERSDRIFIEQIRKLKYLKEHYDISYDGFAGMFFLLLAVVEQHVPGFTYREPSPGGRPKKWNEEKLTHLYFDVEKIVRDQHVNITSACSELACKKHWKSFLTAKTNNNEKHETSNDVKQLEDRYYEARKSKMVKFILSLNYKITSIRPDLGDELASSIAMEMFCSKNG